MRPDELSYVEPLERLPTEDEFIYFLNVPTARN